MSRSPIEGLENTTENIMIIGIKTNFLHLGQGLIDFVEATGLTRDQAQKLKDEYGKKYQIEIGVLASKEPDTYTLRARKKSQGDK